MKTKTPEQIMMEEIRKNVIDIIITPDISETARLMNQNKYAHTEVKFPEDNPQLNWKRNF
jgi:hypothetical protein